MDEPTWPCFIIKDLGTLDVDLSSAAADLRCVLVFLRLRAMDGGDEKIEFYFRNSIILSHDQQQTQIISWPLDADIVACTEQTATTVTVFAFSSNRINFSSQDPNIVTRSTHHRPNMGRSGARRWTKGSSQAHRYTDRSRVCPLDFSECKKPFF
jgi:hypothetical protein